MVIFDIEEQRVVLLALALFLGVTAAQLFSRGGPGRGKPEAPPAPAPAAAQAAAMRPDPNDASLDELLRVPGMSEELASDILRHRSNHIFATRADLEAIPGASRAEIARVAGALCFPGAPPSETKLDLNLASVEELEMLPGVGRSMARAIVKKRDQRKFVHLEELLQLPGIGPGKLEKLQPFLVITKTGGR